MTYMQTPKDFSPFPWMKHALTQYGQREIKGPSENGRIHAYFAAANVRNARDDETAWCSAFVNWCMQQSGILGTRRANARSWLTWGAQCLAKPTYGAITIMWRDRPSSWKGHVAFYVGETPTQVMLLGGNQGIGEVNVKPYPKARLLGYRWPNGYACPQES